MIKPCEPRMYVVVREDLAFKYVQGAHALASHALNWSLDFEEWDNQYLIYLSVFNGLALEELRKTLIEKGLRSFSVFIEPDLQSPLPTALCMFEDGTGKYAHALKDLKLATK